MLPFKKNDPFPLLETYTEIEAQNHAEEVDRWLGLQTHAVEEELLRQGCRLRAPQSSKEHQQLWIGLATTRLQTPYVEIRHMLEFIQPQRGETVVDLGAGYGRMGFVLAHCYPGVFFVGYEYVGERVMEAKRCMRGVPKAKMEHADLNSPRFQLKPADIYFLYDFGHEKAINKVLYDLYRIASTRNIRVIARGRSCREIILNSHPWLECRRVSHATGRYTVYESSLPIQSEQRLSG